jgi:hypothetical protein
MIQRAFTATVSGYRPLLYNSSLQLSSTTLLYNSPLQPFSTYIRPEPLNLYLIRAHHTIFSNFSRHIN